MFLLLISKSQNALIFVFDVCKPKYETVRLIASYEQRRWY